MIYLKSLRLKGAPPADEFPFSIPIVKSLEEVEFTSDVTFIVGENGCGKSTLLEGLAATIGCPSIGHEAIAKDKTLDHARRLAKYLKLSWGTRTHRGFFLRAEDFFGFARSLTQMKEEFQRQLAEYEKEYRAKGRSEYALMQVKGPMAGSLAEMKAKYGENLDANSHGESFLKVFQARFVPEGLYILDEPETPLSPQNQLALMAMIRDMLDQKAQFIIATHSPILAAYPGAQILCCDEGQVRQIAYDDFEHVSLTRSFLNNPERFLRHLMTEGNEDGK